MEIIPVVMGGVTEYCDNDFVALVATAGHWTYPSPGNSIKEGVGRLCIEATNEGGFSHTQVDLLEVLTWVKINRPDIWDSI